MTSADPSEDPLETLLRWESFGGTWELLSWSSAEVTVSLRRCDGGEEAAQLRSDSPQLRQYVGRGAAAPDVADQP